ncbi:MAG: hypothetical protein R3F54_15655 [Alphaproteobacteria bacterium]
MVNSLNIRDFIVDGLMIDDFLDDAGRLACVVPHVIPSLDGNLSNIDEVLERVQGLNQVGVVDSSVRETSPEFCGLPGFLSFQLLKFLNSRLKAGFGSEQRCKVNGKIFDYEMTVDEVDENGHPSECHGSLVVDMLYETYNSNQDLIACKPNRVDFYRWYILVGRCILHKRAQDGEFFPKYPFPELQGGINPGDSEMTKAVKAAGEGAKIKFPWLALNPDDPRSLWCRCLNCKIYAEGSDVMVDKIFRRLNIPAEELEATIGECVGLEKLPKSENDPDATHCWYDQRPDACVDLMLRRAEDGSIPLTIEELRDRGTDYCLGRCAYPPVVNTGGN